MISKKATIYTKSSFAYKNVSIGKGATIEPGVIIGLPPHGKKDGELKTFIGKNSHIRPYTVIYAGVKIGDNFQTGPNVLIREGNRIGNDVVVWHGATLNPGNKIGDKSRIHVGCFLEDVTLGKRVFVGPNVTFANDPHPSVPIKFRECWKGARVADGAVIGANATLLPHVTIGKRALVGAGAVVVDNIPDYKVAIGNPAKVVKDIKDVVCRRRGRRAHRPYLTKGS